MLSSTRPRLPGGRRVSGAAHGLGNEEFYLEGGEKGLVLGFPRGRNMGLVVVVGVVGPEGNHLA